MAQWLTIKHFRSITILHTKTLDQPPVILVISSPRCYIIYWFITLEVVSDMLNNFLNIMGCPFFGGRGLTKRDKAEGVTNVHFLGNVFKMDAPILHATFQFL